MHFLEELDEKRGLSPSPLLAPASQRKLMVSIPFPIHQLFSTHGSSIKVCFASLIFLSMSSLPNCSQTAFLLIFFPSKVMIVLIVVSPLSYALSVFPFGMYIYHSKCII